MLLDERERFTGAQVLWRTVRQPKKREMGSQPELPISERGRDEARIKRID
jgi:hypothetical protein